MRFLLAFVLCTLACIHLRAKQQRCADFLRKTIPREQKLEQQARAVPDPARLRKYMDFISVSPAQRRVPAIEGDCRIHSGHLQGMGTRRTDRGV